MSRFVLPAIFLMLFSLHSVTGIGQEKKKKTKEISDYIPTENIDGRKEANNYKNRPKRKVIEYIYKNDTKGVLYGNPCAIEATRKMGFEYVIQPFGVPGSMLLEDQFTNNFLVHVKLIFTRSPFWKLILKKRIRECEDMSGDMRG